MLKKYVKGKSVKLSENFKSTEFDCHGFGCCSETTVDLELVDILQEIRNHFGKAVTINSGFRCKAHNKAVGGASKSKHLSGCAADICVSEVAPSEVAKFAESIGVKGIGLYADFVHIDTREVKSFWYGHSEQPMLTFGGAPEVEISVLEFQKSAKADGFSFPKFGLDGKWGSECEVVAKKAVCKKRLTYKYKNLTKLVQKKVGVTADGKFGTDTKTAVKAWQKANKLTADGEVGLNTWKKILEVK